MKPVWSGACWRSTDVALSRLEPPSSHRRHQASVVTLSAKISSTLSSSPGSIDIWFNAAWDEDDRMQRVFEMKNSSIFQLLSFFFCRSQLDPDWEISFAVRPISRRRVWTLSHRKLKNLYIFHVSLWGKIGVNFSILEIMMRNSAEFLGEKLLFLGLRNEWRIEFAENNIENRSKIYRRDEMSSRYISFHLSQECCWLLGWISFVFARCCCRRPMEFP